MALVHAVAGSVGLLLTQLLIAKGVVIGMTSTDAKAGLAREAGIAQVIRYNRDDGLLPYEQRIRVACTSFTILWVQATWDASLRSLSRRGTLVLYGHSQR